MTEAKQNELCEIYRKIQPDLQKIDDVDSIVVFLCSLLSTWCKENNVCRIEVVTLIFQAIMEVESNETD